MKIAAVIASLDAGGAENVMSILANHWVGEGHEVSIITYAASRKDFYPLHSQIERVRVVGFTPSESRWDAVRVNCRLVGALRRTFLKRQPDVIVSFIDMTNIVTLLATLGTGIPVVISERIDVRQHDIGPRLSFLRKMTYRWADALVVQSNAVAAEFAYLQGVRRAVLPNPVLPPRSSGKEPAAGLVQRPFIMAMGRIVEQKGFDLLLTSFARVSSRNPAWTLVIVGEGPKRPQLEEQARQLGIASRVRFLGLIHRPFESVGVPDLFVLSSRFEGFPNALCEAMAHGAACVSFDCPTGPAEIIRDNWDGLLVSSIDSDALAFAIEQMMQNSQLRHQIASRAPHIVERLDARRIARNWLQLFREIAGACSDAADMHTPSISNGAAS